MNSRGAIHPCYSQQLHQWLHMFDTSLIQVFHQLLFYSYVSKKVVKILAELSILNSGGATKKVAALEASTSCSGASHSSEYKSYLSDIAASNSEKDYFRLSARFENTKWRHTQVVTHTSSGTRNMA